MEFLILKVLFFEFTQPRPLSVGPFMCGTRDWASLQQRKVAICLPLRPLGLNLGSARCDAGRREQRELRDDLYCLIDTWLRPDTK